MTRRRRIVLCLLLILAAVAALAAWHCNRIMLIATAYTAKTVCSGVFVSLRDPVEVHAEDVLADNTALLALVRPALDRERQAVSATAFGLARRIAIHRPGLGCAIALGDDENSLLRNAAAMVTTSKPTSPAGVQDLEDDAASPGVDRTKLMRALEAAFSEPDPKRLRRTRAVVVVHDGRIVAERYAPGYMRDTPLPGWSMTKSALNAIVGALVAEGRLTLDAPDLLPEWREAKDPRSAITLDHLMRMSSGLSFDEDYRNPLSDVVVMLFGVADAARYAANKPLAAPPGTRFKYASGTSNIISRILRATAADDAVYWLLPRRVLFDRIGMRSAVLETDSSGTFVASSFMYATARDWARLGLLYLQDGRWGGERVLPEGWVKYSITPAPAAPDGQYGAHFWLKLAGRSPDRLPAGSFHMSGHDGQFVTVVPSKKLVIARLGLSRLRGAWDQTAFAAEIGSAIGD